MNLRCTKILHSYFYYLSLEIDSGDLLHSADSFIFLFINKNRVIQQIEKGDGGVVYL